MAMTGKSVKCEQITSCETIIEVKDKNDEENSQDPPTSLSLLSSHCFSSTVFSACEKLIA